jgi:hypothetical protein
MLVPQPMAPLLVGGQHGRCLDTNSTYVINPFEQSTGARSQQSAVITGRRVNWSGKAHPQVLINDFLGTIARSSWSLSRHVQRIGAPSKSLSGWKSGTLILNLRTHDCQLYVQLGTWHQHPSFVPVLYKPFGPRLAPLTTDFNFCFERQGTICFLIRSVFPLSCSGRRTPTLHSCGSCMLPAACGLNPNVFSRVRLHYQSCPAASSPLFRDITDNFRGRGS